MFHCFGGAKLFGCFQSGMPIRAALYGSGHEVVVAASVTGGGAVLSAAAAGPGMAGAGCRRGRPRAVSLVLPSWRRAWAWAAVWLRFQVVVR